jgi:ABC-type nickel/cobalt efflux system permease component RcnA
MRTTARLALLALCATTLLSLATPAAVSAHPLGNFTINVYNGITVATDRIHLDRVVDMAELPSVTARREIDTDRDAVLSDAEAAAWAERQCAAAPREMTLVLAGRPLELVSDTVGITFPAGQAGLSTLRLVCGYAASLAATAASTPVEFRDETYASRAGWRELVVAAAGVSVTGAEEFAASSSGRLLAYPANTGAALPQQSAAAFSFTASSSVPASALPVIGDAVPLGSAPADVVMDAMSPAALPGASDLPTQIGALIQASDLSPVALLIALAVAAGVGAFHAATPGHGKTLMAAYLVGSRGTVRDALGLGLTVTVAHTVGVFALGAIVLIAGAALPSERLLPILGLVSGLIVTVLGASMLLQRIRSRRHHGAADHEQEHGHAHAHDDEQAGWHSHGAVRHTHLPASDGPLRRRNLLALGLVGGLVPSASAILILVGSIAAGRPVLGMILTVAFGAGMAAVLVGVGVLLVKARSFVDRIPNPGLGRTLAYAPLVSAIVFLVLGAAITVQAGLEIR